MTKKQNLKTTGFNFESSLKKLEKIAQEIESGDLTLQASLSQFEDGMALAKACQDYLNEATGKVEKVVKDMGGNEKLQEVTAEEFEGE